MHKGCVLLALTLFGLVRLDVDDDEREGGQGRTKGGQREDKQSKNRDNMEFDRQTERQAEERTDALGSTLPRFNGFAARGFDLKSRRVLARRGKR